MAGTGAVSIKERQALLMGGTKNPLLAGEPVKAKPPPVTTKPAPTTTTHHHSALRPVGERTAPGGAFGGGRGVGVLKPPPTAAKPWSGGGGGGAEKTVNGDAHEAGENGNSGGGSVSDSPFLRKLKHVEPPVAVKPLGGGGRVGGGGTAPVALIPPKKPWSATSPESSPAAASSSSPSATATASSVSGSDSSMKDTKASEVAGGTPRRSMSITEKIAALQAKAGSSEGGNDSVGKGGGGGGGGTAHSTTSPRDGAVPVSPLSPKPTPLSSAPKPAFFGHVPGPFGPKPGAVAPKPGDLAKSLREAAQRKNQRKSDVFLRNSDQKKFRKLDSPSESSSDLPPPPKPKAIDNVDLTTFVKAYATAKEKKIEVDAARSDLPQSDADHGEPEEMYIDAGSTQVTVRRGRGSLNRAKSVRVSQIPEYTEEEEDQDLDYDDATSCNPNPTIQGPEETYDDCESGAPIHEPEIDDPDEIYEPLEDLDTQDSNDGGAKLEPPEPPPTPPSPNPSKDRKEKEKKEKVKKKDDEQKKAEKEEKERRKLRAKFGLTDTDQKEGEGIVKAKEGGGLLSSNLAVKQGETVSILRMDKNPTGKWLVQNENGKIGYVSSSNIEVSTSTIRNLMTSAKKDSVADAEPQEDDDPDDVYEALPGDEGEMDDIYEDTT